MPSQTSRKKTRGFSLVEISIVLGVAGAIIAAVWGAGTLVKNTANSTNAVSQIHIVQQNMSDYAKSGYNPAAGTNITAAMITAGVIPDWAISPTDNNKASHPWNQTGFQMFWSVPPINVKTFRVSLYKVGTLGDCVNVILNTVTCTSPRSGCTYAVYTNIAGSQQILATTPLTSQSAYALCNANNYTGAGNNSVEFDFYP